MSRSTRTRSRPAVHKHAKPQKQTSRIWIDILVGILLASMLAWVKGKYEQTELGQLTEQATYEFLQHRLSLSANPVPIPATVVDISPIEAVKSERGIYKPRGPLMDIIKAIAAQNPVAIGVDIEFSPLDNGDFETDDDPAFFTACKEIVSQGVPVFLAVNRGVAAIDATYWLGRPSYQSLAANVIIPRKRDTPVLVQWSEVPTQPKPLRLPSMSAKLADAYRAKANQAADEKSFLSHLSWVFEDTSLGGTHNVFATEEYFVDYSMVGALHEGIIRAAGANDVLHQTGKLTGRIVLLGNADFENLPPDSFVVPGQDQPVPGVYIHAAGAITLINGPLFNVTENGKYLLDVLLAILVIGTVAAIRIYFEKSGEEISESRVQLVITIAAVVAVIVSGGIFVGTTRIIWTDFLLVALTLWIHPSLERDLPDLWHGVKQAARSMVTEVKKEER